MYDHNDRIAEELSNYCTDLREQLRDSKSTVTWLSEQKVLADTALREEVALGKVASARVEDLEAEVKEDDSIYKNESEEWGKEIAQVQKELDDVEYKYQGLREENTTLSKRVKYLEGQLSGALS
jgi:chromosome segregation ATPase